MLIWQLKMPTGNFFISEYLNESMSQKLKFSATDFSLAHAPHKADSAVVRLQSSVAIDENNFAHYGKHQNQNLK